MNFTNIDKQNNSLYKKIRKHILPAKENFKGEII